MKKSVIILIFILVGFPQVGYSQEVIKKKKYKTVTLVRKPTQNWPLTVSWYSPFLIHSGISLQTDYVLRERNKLINRRRLLRLSGLHPADKFREKSKYNLLEPGIIFYNQKDFHTGLSANCLFKMRWVRYRGFSYEAGAGLGFLWTIYQDKTYVVKSDGEIKERSLAGRLYLAPTFSFGFGYDFSRSKLHRNWGALKLQFITVTPVKMNSSLGMLGYMQLGYTFKLNAFSNWMNKKITKK